MFLRNKRSHTNRFRVSACAVALTATLILSACGTSTDSSDHDESLTIATSFAIPDIVPLENSFWGPEFGYVELLMRPAIDGKPTPWVLKSLTNVDEKTRERGLRDNVQFTNGTKLEADALVNLIE